MLFQQTPNADSSLPTDTISAALNIVRNPQRNVANILGIPVPNAPFQQATTSATDLTLAVTYTGSGIASPTALAIDASGNVWVTNTGSGPNTSSVTEISHTGTTLSGTSGYSAGGINLPSAIAIDTAGNAWIANANSTLSEIDNSGNAVGTSPFSGGGLSTPTSIAIDGVGNLWLSNAGNTVSEFSSSGAPLSGSGFVSSGLSAPVGVAIDPH
jgi:secreted PhoX family phosphatase